MDDVEDTVYYWAQRYVTSSDDADDNPGAYDDAELEYCEDNLRRLLNKEQQS